MNNDTIAERYESTSNLPARRRARKRIHWLCAQAEGKDILDVGCSQGIASILLGQDGRNVIGIDHETAAIAEANRRLEAEEEILRTRVKFIQAEAGDLPFPDAAFDTVLLGEVIEHQVDSRPILREVARLLRRGGRVVITVPYGRDDFYDHKEPLYLGNLLELLDEFFTVDRLELIDRWLGLVTVLKKKVSHRDRADLLGIALQAAEARLGHQDVALEDAKGRERANRREFKDLRAELKKETEVAAAAERRLHGLEDEVAKRSREAAEAERRVGELTAEAVDRRVALAKTQEHVEGLEREASERVAQLAAARRRLEVVEGDAVSLSAELNIARQREQALEAEVARRRTEREQLAAESVDHRVALSAAQERVQSMQDQLEAAQGQGASLGVELGEARQRMEELERELEESRARIAAAAQDARLVAAQEQRQDELEAVIEALAARGSKLTHRLAAMEHEAIRRGNASTVTLAAVTSGVGPRVVDVGTDELAGEDVPVGTSVDEADAPAAGVTVSDNTEASADPPVRLPDPEAAAPAESEGLDIDASGLGAHESSAQVVELARRNRELEQRLADDQRVLRKAEQRVGDVVAAAREDIERLRALVQGGGLDPDSLPFEGATWQARPVRSRQLVGCIGNAWVPNALGFETRPVDAQSIRNDLGQALKGLSMVIVGSDSGALSSSLMTKLESAAESRGIRLINLGREGAAAIDPFDSKVINPVGYLNRTQARYGVVATEGHAVKPSQVKALLEGLSTRGELVGFGSGGRLADAVSGHGGQVLAQPFSAGVHAELRRCRAVFDHPALHPTPVARAEQLVRVAATGVPIVLGPKHQVLGPLLGSDLLAAIRGVTPDLLEDATGLEAASVEMRRLALRHHSVSGRWDRAGVDLPLGLRLRPSVTVLMTASRRDQVPFALDQLAAQTYGERELVLVLCGEDLGRGIEAEVSDRFQGEVTILRAPADEAVNCGLAVASGDVVTRWEGANWYGSEHVEDLVLALDYSRADLVGKAAEFTYVPTRDVTQRRWSSGSERPGTRISAAAIAVPRGVLNDVGGWPQGGRVERSLVDVLKTSGGTTYRTHGLGFVAAGNRKVDHADAEWSGLALHAAGISPGLRAVPAN